jgi:hypothetical protein
MTGNVASELTGMLNELAVLEPLFIGRDIDSFLAGWLYTHVVASTVEAPTMKGGFMRKSNKTTEARKDRMME